MGEAYRGAFRQFTQSGFESAVGDKAVAGIDRVPTDLLTKARQRLVALAAQRAEEASADIASTMRNALLLLAGLAAVGVAAFLIVIRRSVSRPLTQIVGVLTDLAGGNTKIVVEGLERRDEIGALAGAVQTFRTGMIETERLRAEQQAEQQRRLERGRRIETSVAGFETLIGEVVNSVSAASTELEQTAQSMSATSEETARQSAAVAAASEEASQNVQTVSSATEELSASIREIAQQVGNSKNMIGDAVAHANASNERVQSLSAAAEKIGEIVQLISDIASQTNLLALNATIEAARAGEMGKGFAVVAAEVKSLANQTAKATEEIAAQVHGVQDATRSSVQAIRSMAETVSRLNENAAAIASAVEQQGAATQEIARNVEQAARGTSAVTANIASVNEANQATGEAAAQLLSSANDLSRNSEHLKRQVQEFLTEVRAA
jgi:methyl-accepting chemotaxis protein